MTDTIAAIATAHQKSAIGIIRISGENTFSVVKQVFHSKSSFIKPRRMTFGYFTDSENVRVDEGLCVVMRAPSSYTGEDSAEFYCHGSLGVLSCVLDAVYRAGARPAAAGEFTKRAFLSGRMDLTQAEAVVDIIDSESREAARTAAAQLNGALGRKITEARDTLVALAAHMCAAVDYPEDDVPELLMSDAENTLRKSLSSVNALLGTYKRGAIIKNGIPCAILGRPNVGKSSLLNMLSGFERSIVTDIAGTTRDMVEQSVSIGGMMLRLQDTAGLCDTSDTVEKIGVRRAYECARDASLLLAVFDASRPLSDEDMLTLEHSKDKNTICVINKWDLEHKIEISVLKQHFTDLITLSSKTGAGIDTLCAEIEKRFFLGELEYEEGIVTNPRHVDALRRSGESIEMAADGIALGMTADVVTVDIECAIDALGEITGQTASEDIMSGIFSRFCVGK